MPSYPNLATASSSTQHLTQAQSAEPASQAVGTDTSPAASPVARPISRGSTPSQSMRDSVSIMMDRFDSQSEHGSSLTALPAMETRNQPSAQIAAQRARMAAALHAHHTPLTRLVEQFKLEGVAVRDILNSDQDVAALASGAMTRQAVADQLPAARRELLVRANVYAAMNLGGDAALALPFSNQQLAAAGITGTEQQLATQGLCLTHDAYQAALQHLADSGAPAADVEHVKLAHEAFKVAIAETENTLELQLIGLEIKGEAIANKLPIFKTQAERATKQAELAPELAGARSALAAHARASNHILHDEHIADHWRRAIGAPADGVLATADKFVKQMVASGGPQAASSLIHWGYMRNLGALLGDHLMQGKTGPGPAVASTLIQALALATSHKFVSDGPRELFHSAAEIGGWARPPEASNVSQLMPDAPASRLSATGEPVAVAEATLEAAQQAVVNNRAQFKALSPTFGLGNADGDLVGEAAFGSANALRDIAHSAGFAAANSLHGRAVTSAVGGETMLTVQATGQLAHRVMGLPAYVTAKRANPRGVVQRVLTAGQKMDLTQEANRMDFLSKLFSVSIGMLMAAGIDRVASAPLQHALEQADNDGAKAALMIAHSLTEGSKSFATLAAFFSGLVAFVEAKALPGTMSTQMKRLQIGWENLSNPGREAAASAYAKGSIGYKRQLANNVVKGAAQIPAQAAAVGTEAALSGGVKLVGNGLSAAMAKLRRSSQVDIPPGINMV